MTRLAPRLATGLISCLLVTLVATACGSTVPHPLASPTASGPLTFVSAEYGFSITYDRRFAVIKPAAAPMIRFKLTFSEPVRTAEHVASSNFSVTGLGVTSRSRLATEHRDTTLRKLIADLVKAEGGSVRDWRDTTIDGLPAAMKKGEGSVATSQRLTCIVVGAKDVYLMVGETARESWRECLPLFTAAFETFHEV